MNCYLTENNMANHTEYKTTEVILIEFFSYLKVVLYSIGMSQSYYKTRSVTVCVCPATPPPFMDRWIPNCNSPGCG